MESLRPPKILSLILGAGVSMFTILGVLVYQPVLPDGLIRTNIEIRLIVNKYNYISHTIFHLLNTLTYTLKYIFIIM